MGEKILNMIEKWIFYFLAGFAFFSNLSIAAGNVFLGLTLLLIIFRILKKHDDLKNFIQLDKGLMVTMGSLMGITVLSAILSTEPVAALGVFSDYYLYRMLTFFSVLLVVRKRSQLLFLLKLAALSFLINSGYVLWQGWQGIPRASGFIFCMSTAAFLSMGVPAFLLFLLRNSGKKSKYIAGIGVIISLWAALYNATRGAWVSIGVTSVLLVLLAVENKRRAVWGCLAGIAVISTIFMTNPLLQQRIETIGQTNYRSNHERLLLWESAYHMFEDHPVLGIGYGQFKKAYQNKYILPEAEQPWLGHAHNNVMQVLAECGILGCIAFLSMWIYFTYFSIRGWRQERKWEYLFFFIVVTSTMIQGLTEYNMGNSMVMKLYWLLLGISLQLINIDKGMVTEK